MTDAPPLDAALADDVAEIVDTCNGRNADTVLLIARVLAGTSDAVDAQVAGFDTGGVELEVRVDDGTTARTRVEFPERVTTVDQLWGALYGLIARARSIVGDSVPLTAAERASSSIGTLPTFVTEVVSSRQLTPNLLELVIGGAGLAEFESKGGDEFFWTMTARPGADPLPDGYAMAEWMAAAESPTRPFGAYYTVRRWDPERHEITLWAVLHHHADDDADAGITGVGTWFEHCAPGDRLAIWGPRAGAWGDDVYRVDATGGSATGSRHHLFVTDESGFAAVCALIELLPESDTATVVAETIDEQHAIDFPGARTTVHWRYRGDEHPGVGTGLLDLVRAATADVDLATAFGAGESRQITQIRKHLRNDRGLQAKFVSMTGYWRRA